MKIRTLFVINAVICIIFGVTLVIIPWLVISLYGITPNPALNYIGQLLGAALISIAILSWIVRNAAESGTRSAIIRAFFIGDGIGFIVSLIAQLSGVVNLWGWSTVAIYFLLTLGFGYFRFAETTISES